MDSFADLLDLQHGVISRRQALTTGHTDNDLRRMVRRRVLVALHPGVYLNHTGEASWIQRAWAAVLFAQPAALFGQSALRIEDGPGRRWFDDTGPIHIAVEHARTVVAPPGVVVHRVLHLASMTRTSAQPPRVRIEHAALDHAATAPSDLAAIAVLADVVRSRRTTPHRLAMALDARSRIARRALMAGLLSDLETGTHSVLEHVYRQRVERAHGLPVGTRQVRATRRGVTYQDVEYEDFGVVVELDGRDFHTSTFDRDLDMTRDLVTATTGRQTLRVGWGQSHERACETASLVGQVLGRRGWTGFPRRCRHCPR